MGTQAGLSLLVSIPPPFSGRLYQSQFNLQLLLYTQSNRSCTQMSVVLSPELPVTSLLSGKHI